MAPKCVEAGSLSMSGGSERSIRSYKDLDVWQKSMALAEDCYRATSEFPRDEIYGMTAQMRRAAVSIPANIAEGYGRDQTGPFIQFLRIANGSTRELETHVILSGRFEPIAISRRSAGLRDAGLRVAEVTSPRTPR